MKKQDLELYTDYLISNFGQATATGLSAMVNGEVSHDHITRFLTENKFSSKDLCLYVKKVVREIENQNDGVLPRLTYQLPLKTQKQSRLTTRLQFLHLFC